MGRATANALKSLGYQVISWTRTQRSGNDAYGRWYLLQSWPLPSGFDNTVCAWYDGNSIMVKQQLPSTLPA
jgi:hypothetical protein